MTMLDAALSLAGRGLKVFPVKAGAKSPPTIPGWPDHATTNADTVSLWWRLNPDANIGVHCAGLLVVDVDPKSGGDESFEMLRDMLPETFTVRTPSGGGHYYFRLPDDHPGVKNSVGELAPGIDVRSTHGYVVAPGSETARGKYEVAADLPVAPAPGWLVQQCGTFTEREQAPKVNVPDAPDEALARAAEWLATHPGAVEGDGGDAHTFATACRLRDFGVSEAQAVALMAGDWNATCSPPWELSDLRQKARNAYRYAQEGAAGKLLVTPEDFPAVEAPPVPPKPARPGPMRLAALAGAATGPAPYLIKNLLQKGSHAVLYGAPGEGKTFVALDLAYHVAAGREWHGHRVAQGLALYLAFEGVGGLSRRGAALMAHYGAEDVPLYVQPADYNLREPAGRRALGEMLATLPARPALIVIDTLARAMKGGDENSAQDMGALNDAVGALIASTGACVLLIHHSGKNKASGARGSSALLGAVDTEIEVADSQIAPTKQRDVEMASPIGFHLHPIMLGVDEDGDEITSCVVMPAAAVKAKVRGLRGQQRDVWDALCEASPQNVPIDADAWWTACSGLVTQRNTFNHARTRLLKMGAVVATDDGKYKRRLE